MATRTHNGGSGGHRALARMPYILEEVVDFAEMAADLTIGTTDVIQVLKLPAKTLVLFAGMDKLTAETTNTTAQLALGDGDSAGLYVAAATIASVAHSTIASTANDGKAYASADTIDITISVDDPVNAKVRVYAVCVDYSSPNTTDYKTYA